MNRIKKIAYTIAPIVAIAALVPGGRWLFNWRETHKVPRVEACYLRVPTAKERSHGADVGYTARVVVPDTGGPFWSYKIEFSNADGGHWINDTLAWNRIVVASASRDWSNSDWIEPGNADNRNGVTMEMTGGLKWQRIAGKHADIHAEISLFPDDGPDALQVKESRVFTLNSPAPLPK